VNRPGTHVQLGTAYQISPAPPPTSANQSPNSQTSMPDGAGLPGTCGAESKVLEYAVEAALALNLQVPKHSKFRPQIS